MMIYREIQVRSVLCRLGLHAWRLSDLFGARVCERCQRFDLKRIRR